MFQLSHGTKNIHRSKSYAIRYKLEKRVFAAATFKGLWVVSFQTKQEKRVVYFGLFKSVFLSLLYLSRGNATK